MNNSWNRATGSTPFFLNSGDHPRTPVNVDVVTPLPAANAFVGRVWDALSCAHSSLLYAQRRMSEHAVKARRDEQLEVGDYVLLSTKFLRLFHLGRKKLLSKYLGPFEVMTKKGAVAYELRLPASMSRMFNAFHVSLLKRYKDGCRGAAPPPAVLDDGETECEIDKVLAHRDTKTGRRSYYVQWRGLPPEENDWLPASKLRNAADVVQHYLNDSNSVTRPAARVGRPDSALLLSLFRILQMRTILCSSQKPAILFSNQGGAEAVLGRLTQCRAMLSQSAAETGLGSSADVLHCPAVACLCVCARPGTVCMPVVWQ